jgi:hypothetical protein
MSRTNRQDNGLHGRVQCITDHGSIVLVTIDDGQRMRHLAADGNAWRRNGAAENIHEGDGVEFALTDWGGLASISVEGGDNDD